MIQFDFSQQTVIVTGGTRSIGRAISEAFLKAGARVIAIHTGTNDSVNKFISENEKYGDKLITEALDVSNHENVKSFFDSYSERFGELHILVNNAGIRRDSALVMMPRDQWDHVLSINLGGVFNMCKHAMRLFTSARYGRVINISSPSGRLGFDGQSNYAASKAGMEALTKSLSKEVAKRKITVNCVSPGFIATDLISDLSEDKVKEYQSMVHLKRFGTPEEVASAVLFLSSKESSYITGITLEVTGGL